MEDRIRVTALTLARGPLLIHLVECTVCGPVAVDTSNRPQYQVVSEHMAEVHMQGIIGGVPA